MSNQTAGGISVLLVDDYPTLRAGVRAVLEKTHDIYVIGEAGNGEEARNLLDRTRTANFALGSRGDGQQEYRNKINHNHKNC